MTQPAKVQEPSMEEILASIRRIIADDEAKPPAASEKPASPPVQAKPPETKPPEKPAAPQPAAKEPVKPPVMSNVPPSAIPAAQAPAAKVTTPPVKPAPPPAAPAPAAGASNSQDDIDAMLAGLDEATSEAEIRPPLPDGEVFELTDDMALPEPPKSSFHRIEPNDDLEFSETAAARAVHRQPAFEPPPFETSAPPPQQILSRSTVSAVESAFNTLANTVLSNNARTLEDLVKEMLRPMLKSWLDDNLPGLVERIVRAEIERVSRGGR
jgi:cell pole-organizing protein PopZ